MVQNPRYKHWLATWWLTSVLFFATAQTVWNKTYVEDRPVMLFGSVIATDTSYIVSGATYGANSIVKSMLGRIDSFGMFSHYSLVIDSNNQNYYTTFNALITNHNSFFVYAGSTYDTTANLFLAISNKGMDSTVLYQYYTPNTYAYNVYDLIEVGEFYYLAGIRTDRLTNNGDMTLAKIDSAGNRIWERFYNQKKYDYAASITSLNNNNLLLGGHRNDLNSTNERSNTWLMEVDTGGQMVRQWFDPNDSTYAAEGLLQTMDGGFIYGAQKKFEQTVGGVYKTATIVKLNYNFTRQWIIEGGIKGDHTGIKDIEFVDDTTYIACGNYANGQGWVIKFTDIGNILWEKKYKGLQPSGTWNILKDIDVLPDGSFIAAGYCQWIVNPNNNPPQVGWLLKLDVDGCEMESCLVGINETPKSPAEGGDLNSQIQVYPNPAQSALTIQYDNLPYGSILYVFNATGALIETQPVTGSAGKLTLNTAAYPNGIYLARIEVEGKALLKEKFIVLK
ncbi:MAG TPA: T9SS type A sorting domain-containing protein [Chitinophagales bacterium]|nr:T9SS type A sorting domain-containing protein [Chitinophagales bacterium]